ncbi:MAG: molybdopterin molybdotransferase MoeA [Fimbriimonadaceae bacterium]|nr:molybdopterin molybdotransferase MoeA [Fimbriimonadaceae bacterium]
MISFAEAQRLVVARRLPDLAVEVGLGQCLGRVLAESVASPFDFPLFDNSAMDGFAVGEGEGAWQVVREIAAGSAPGPELRAGEAARIYTGAPTPPGTWAVVPQEDAVLDGDRLTAGPLKEGAHIRRRGEEVAAGSLIVNEGCLVTPPVVAALSSVGLDRVKVVSPPAVAVLGTGDEVVAPGTSLGEGQIYDSNLAAVGAVLGSWGATVTARHVDDDPKALGDAVGDLLADHDLLVTTGGVSVGSRDYMMDVMSGQSFEVHFHGVAMKPGKPLAFATRPDGKAWFGLPGNPLSTWTGLLMFVGPFLGHPLRMERRTLAAGLTRKPGREEFVPFFLAPTGEVDVKDTVGSHANFGLLGADGLVQISASTAVLSAGDEVETHWFPWETRR